MQEANPYINLGKAFISPRAGRSLTSIPSAIDSAFLRLTYWQVFVKILSFSAKSCRRKHSSKHLNKRYKCSIDPRLSDKRHIQ